MNEKLKLWVRKTACIFSICLLAVLAVPGMKSEAASKKPTCVKKQTVYLTRGDNPYTRAYYNFRQNSSAIYVKNLSSNAKITNLKSSNKKIKVHSGLYANKKTVGRFKGVWVEASGCKAGTKSKISFKVKQNGKTYSLSCTVTVKKAPTIFSKLSIGGKNYASKFSGYSDRILTLPKNKKIKFSVKMKSGTKLNEIRLVSKKGVKKIKNGQKVTLKKGDYFVIDFTYTKKPANYSSCLYGPKNWLLTDGMYIYVK